jgi:hypothetical protein
LEFFDSKNPILFGLEIQTKIFKTTENPHVCLTLSQMAVQLINMGEYHKALQQFESVLGKKSYVI